jgi:hypothetical protein
MIFVTDNDYGHRINLMNFIANSGGSIKGGVFWKMKTILWLDGMPYRVALLGLGPAVRFRFCLRADARPIPVHMQREAVPGPSRNAASYSHELDRRLPRKGTAVADLSFTMIMGLCETARLRDGVDCF